MATDWHRTTKPPELNASDVHVWLVDLDEYRVQASEFQSTLSECEQQRAKRFVRDHDRENYIVGRAILRRVLAGYLKLEPSALEIDTDTYGKPFIRKLLNNNDIKFNLSHSGGLVLLAVRCGAEIGVDIEKIRDNAQPADLAKRYFSPIEVSELSALPEGLRNLGFFLCWTRKEAYLKALGNGLQTPLNSFAVTFTPGVTPELTSADSSRWKVVALEPSDGYVGALVTERGPLALTYYKYTT